MLQNDSGENYQAPIESPKTPKCLAGWEGRGMEVLVIDFWGFMVPITPKWVLDELPKIST